jgi:uncharacterized membrane protein YoaK (UPF0700 family)
MPAPRTSIGASAVLAAVGGFMDAACFLGLFSVFTAHVTGNIAILASELARPIEGVLLRAEVLPAFACGIASAYIAMSARQPAAGDAGMRRGLLVQMAWFGFLLADLILPGPPATDSSASAYIITFCAGAGMGAQAATSRLCGRVAQATSVMTSNFTQFVIGIIDLFRGRRQPGDSRQLALLGTVLMAFGAGAGAGALAEIRCGLASIAAPLLALGGLVVWLSTTARR